MTMTVRSFTALVVLTFVVPPSVAQPKGTAPRTSMNPAISAIDARWSNYGAYLMHMHERISQRWHTILKDRKIVSHAGMSVAVKFVLDAEGKVSRVLDVRPESTDESVKACVAGIVDGAPYGPWPREMKTLLGDHQTLTLTFEYQ